MKTCNLTSVSEFQLMDFSEDPDLQPILFGLFLTMYLVTVLRNLLIILAVIYDSHLHTPMYFFLSNLSLADICFISTTVPKMIVDIQTHSRVISYAGCLMQMNLFIIFMCMDDLLLTVMAYDRFVAICHPLHYAVIMNPHLCVLLILVSFFFSLFISQVHNFLVLKLTCIKDVKIANFFCHPSQLLALSCSDTLTKNIVTYCLGVIFGFFPLAGILYSYSKIVSSILRIPSSGGRYKAFSTCSSHLSVVCLFYVTGLGVYIGSAVSYSPSKGMVASLMYAVVTPMLNPFIYSLRNRDFRRDRARYLQHPAEERQPRITGDDHRKSEHVIILHATPSRPSAVIKHMETHNLTDISEFYLMGFSEDPNLQSVLFGLFLSMYLVTVVGNLLIIVAVSSDSHLHTPMYFFLSSLSLADICFTSTTVPKMIMDILTHKRAISYVGCLTQMSFFIIFGSMDDTILTVMAYDRFVAICHPLRYAVIMNPCLCVLLLLVCVFISLLDSLLHNLIALQFTCFRDVEIANFFCHPTQLLNLSCSDTLIKNLVTYFVGAILGFFPILGILFSYCKIVSSILKIPSSGGRYKAFSTCSSHLSVVCLFYGNGTGVYLASAVSYTPSKGMVASLMYAVVTPMLNPFIYSLRNRDISSTLKRLHSWTV
ncbi:uncharacterized protein O8D03_008384 [Erethizon dorsatum]